MARRRRFPYKTIVVQELLPIDPPRRMRHGQFVLRQMARRQNFLRRVCFTDECIFSSRGVMNKQNYRHWFVKGQNEHVLRPVNHQQRWKIMVWAGIVGDRIVGPFFLDEGVNLNGPVYSALLRDNLPIMFDHIDIAQDDIWWQQDGAPAHNTIGATHLLNQRFGNHWFGRHGPHRWPARSPDLNLLDTFLWAHLKNKCYAEPIGTREEMIERIRRECARITRPMLRNARRNLENRYRCLVQQNGHHIEQFFR